MLEGIGPACSDPRCWCRRWVTLVVSFASSVSDGVRGMRIGEQEGGMRNDEEDRRIAESKLSSQPAKSTR